MWLLPSARKLARELLALRPWKRRVTGSRELEKAAGLVNFLLHKSKVGEFLPRIENKCVKVWCCKMLYTFAKLQADMEQWGMLKQEDSGQSTRYLVG